MSNSGAIRLEGQKEHSAGAARGHRRWLEAEAFRGDESRELQGH